MARQVMLSEAEVRAFSSLLSLDPPSILGVARS